MDADAGRTCRQAGRREVVDPRVLQAAFTESEGEERRVLRVDQCRRLVEAEAREGSNQALLKQPRKSSFVNSRFAFHAQTAIRRCNKRRGERDSLDPPFIGSSRRPA